MKLIMLLHFRFNAGSFLEIQFFYKVIFLYLQEGPENVVHSVQMSDTVVVSN